MFPTSSNRPWRGRPHAPLPLVAVLGAAAVLLAACNSAAPRGAATQPTPVLGQASPKATVIGQPAPPGTGQLGDVSCASALRCWAVGIPGPNASTTTTDAAAVTVIAATTDGGATWKSQPLSLPSAPELSGISCPTVKDCMAVGSTGAVPGTGIVLTTRDGGADWISATVPTGAFVMTAVLCQTAAQCTAIMSDGTNIWGERSLDFGQTWTRGGYLPVGFADPRALSCTLGGSCLVAGYTPTTTGHGQGAIALSVDDGTSWTLATVPSGIGVLQDATCTTPTICLAVGTTSTTVSDVVPGTGLLLASDDGGHTWALSTPRPPIDDVFSVACPTPLICAIVGTHWSGQPAVGSGAVAQSFDGGAKYHTTITAYVPLTLTALSCPTVSECIAVGGDTLARINLPATAPSSTTSSTPGVPSGTTTTVQRTAPLR